MKEHYRKKQGQVNVTLDEPTANRLANVLPDTNNFTIDPSSLNSFMESILIIIFKYSSYIF